MYTLNYSSYLYFSPENLSRNILLSQSKDLDSELPNFEFMALIAFSIFNPITNIFYLYLITLVNEFI
jgi:hypothetical protein